MLFEDLRWVHRVGGDNHAMQAETGQQSGERRGLVASGRHMALGDDGLAAVQDGGQQMDRRFVGGARATHRLAVRHQPDQGFFLLDEIGGVADEPGATVSSGG
ncbi:hypothetical protein GCM10010446_65650 [Streptomyces enissocaesilis]|uniref:DNA mismatch repair proteins mutS family domain-containing protein n=2 Tax=Streptomyces enissocaesilis TaxID=332589 RepID=A0ABP6K8E9_9ACTN